MAIRDTDTHNLKVRTSSSFSDTIIKDVADPVADTDVVNLRKLNATAIAGGWDDAVWDNGTGDLKFKIATVLDETVNLDGRYTTEAEVEVLIADISQAAFRITLGSGNTVQDRIDAAISVPTDWTLTASGLDLIITHNLGRFVGDVTVWAKTIVGTFQKLLNTAAYSGLNASNNAVLVQSLATISKDINIHVIFGE